MLISVLDRMTFGDRQMTADGYLATVGKISRSGTQEYLGSELGRPDLSRVTVYRDADEVFNEDAVRSFAYKPVTDDHPPVSVTSKNWKTYSRGQLGGKALRDGDHLEFPMVVMDQDLIDKIQSGKSDLSAGYTAEILFEDGIAPDGTPYQAKMTSIRGNHCAVVAKGRALTARIGDAWPVETKDSVPPQKEARKMKIVYDGLTVDLSDEAGATAFAKKLTDAKDAAVAVAEAANKALVDAEAKAATDLAAKDAAIAVKDAEIASLTKAVEDAKVTPEQMREMAKAHSVLTDAATKMGFTVTDAMSDAEIKKGAVLARLGDAYKDKSDAFFDAAFEIESAKAPQIDPYRQQMGDRKATDFGNGNPAEAARKARQEMIDGLINPTAAANKE